MAKIHRSPTYPYLTIEDAIKSAQTIYDKEKRHAVPVEVIAQHAGYKDLKSSSAMRSVASLNHYGLVEEDGSGDDRKMKLSNRALDILLAESPTSDTRLSAIRTAAAAPSIHQKILQQFPAGLPSNPTLKNYLIRELNFNDSQVDTFIAKFRKTVDFAKLYSENAGGKESEHEHEDPPADKPMPGDKVLWKGPSDFLAPGIYAVGGLADDGHWVFLQGVPQGVPVSDVKVHKQESLDLPPRNPGYGKPDAIDDQDKPGMEIDRTNLKEGTVVLHWPSELTEESVEELDYWLKGVLRRARRKAGLPPDRTNPRGDSND
jgi:hypothetical protein